MPKKRKRRYHRRSDEERIADLQAEIDAIRARMKDSQDFSPKAVRAERDRLELSAADYGQLVGVSMLTIYNWEHGRSKPRQAQLEKWHAVKGIGKRKAWNLLGY